MPRLLGRPALKLSELPLACVAHPLVRALPSTRITTVAVGCLKSAYDTIRSCVGRRDRPHRPPSRQLALNSNRDSRYNRRAAAAREASGGRDDGDRERDGGGGGGWRRNARGDDDSGGARQHRDEEEGVGWKWLKRVGRLSLCASRIAVEPLRG